jgi:hypothetical protein
VQASGVIDNASLLVLYIFTAAGALIAVEAGWRLGDHRRRRSPDEKEAPIGGVVGAIIGLLAFLLAFTFGMAASRFDARKQLVLEEANAIGTTYLRADLLAEPQRTQERDLLREYAGLRLQAFSERNVTATAHDALAKSQALQARLWSAATTAAAQQPSSVMVSLFVQSLNDTIDMDGKRVTADRNRVPDTIWLMLYLVAVLTMAALGYQFGLTGTRSWIVTICLVLVFTTVIVLVADLDRPARGFVQVSQQPMIDVLNSLNGATPTP